MLQEQEKLSGGKGASDCWGGRLRAQGISVAVKGHSLAARMMIEMFGPDIEAVDEAKAIILESVYEWKN